MGRLIHAAGVMQIPLARFYLAMKIVRRRLHALNHGQATLTDQARLPSSAIEWLEKWRRQALGTRIVEKACNDKRSFLFTDASLKGWGAILVTSDQQIHVTGGSWRFATASGDICKLEAASVSNAIDAFAATIMASQDGELEIVVDNTSVQHALRRGVARSLDVNENIRPALEKLQQSRLKVSTRYIHSKDNPADPTSRGLAFDRKKTCETVTNLRHGGGEAIPIAVSTPS